MSLPTSRSDRRRTRAPRVEAEFGSHAEAALDVIELLELAWHDCYGEVSPPDGVIDDVLVASDGDLERLSRMALLAVIDVRDLRLAADDRR